MDPSLRGRKNHLSFFARSGTDYAVPSSKFYESEIFAA
ncbi:hypothetical protein ABIB34_002254 [Rhodococcus sp. UYP5]